MGAFKKQTTQSDPIRIRMREKRVKKRQQKRKVELVGVDMRERALA
jgi:hypothetical protein